MKTLLAIVAMVLLSTAAWGQVLKGHMEDPTAWKQDGSIEKYCEDKCSIKQNNKVVTTYIECERMCMEEYAKKEPLPDSRYWLEKNDLAKPGSSKYRIMYNDSGKRREVWDGRIDKFSGVGQPATEKEAIEKLEEYRENERIDKAWRRIR